MQQNKVEMQRNAMAKSSARNAELEKELNESKKKLEVGSVESNPFQKSMTICQPELEDKVEMQRKSTVHTMRIWKWS